MTWTARLGIGKTTALPPSPCYARSMSNRIETLDGQGFVELVSHDGDDRSVTRAARVSYGGDFKLRKDHQEQNLIRYLYQNRHTSPFEHVSFTFHVKLPIFVARQWMRHRTWSYNEVSARYTELDEGYYLPPLWRAQSDDNKQMSDGTIDPGDQETAERVYQEAVQHVYWAYHTLLGLGVSREMARFPLSVSTFTRFYGTVDLHNLLHFISLRDHPHAQLEMVEYAQAIRKLIQPIVPMTMEVFDGDS